MKINRFISRMFSIIAIVIKLSGAFGIKNIATLPEVVKDIIIDKGVPGHPAIIVPYPVNIGVEPFTDINGVIVNIGAINSAGKNKNGIPVVLADIVTDHITG
jgi:hypothetical protein